jgi:hypothetical protein
MNDRIAAGTEFVAAMNFGGVDAAALPWTNYNYADCRGRMGEGWHMTGPNTGGAGEYRPYWDRAIGYYEGLRGVKLQYAEQASAKICPDGGGGNYSQNSGGFDHLGFSTLTSWRPAIDASEGITPLSGDILYKGVTYKNQTNLGGLKYKYEVCPSKGIPADGSDITLIPQLPEGAEDSGQWQWSTGETTRQITVKADRSYIYRVSYTAQNGAVSHQSFAIAVSGDAAPDVMTEEITVDGVIERVTDKTVLAGTSVILYAGPTTGWTDDYLWDNGQTGSVVTIPAITSSRTYLCQYANQSGAVSESRFNIHVVEARQIINGVFADEAELLPGSRVEMRLAIPSYANASDISWNDRTTGGTCVVSSLTEDTEVIATYKGTEYRFVLRLMGNGGYPIDATGLIVNPDFSTIDGTGWTMTGTWGNQRFNGAVEVWHSTGFDFSQTISGLPDGEYTVSCQLVNGEGGNTGYLYATSGSETPKATVKQSCAGSDFDTQRDRMAANANYARLSVTVNVTGGTLTIGIKDPSNGTNWLVWDNFTLSCDKGQSTGQIPDVSVTLDKDLVTFANKLKLDFSTPIEGLKAYIVSEVSDGKAVLKEVTGPVPAETGLILKGTAGQSYKIPYTIGATDALDNKLVGVTVDTAIGGNGLDYILQDSKFVKANAGMLKAGKAYLKLDAALGREVIEIDGITSGVNEELRMRNEESATAPVFNLHGQRMSKPGKGLNIVGGKKIIKKARL